MPAWHLQGHLPDSQFCWFSKLLFRDALLWESGFLAFLVAPWNIVLLPWKYGKFMFFKCRRFRYSHSSSLSFCSSIGASVVPQSGSQSASPSACQPVSLSVHQAVRQSVSLLVSLFICLSICPFCPSASPSFCPLVCPDRWLPTADYWLLMGDYWLLRLLRLLATDHRMTACLSD